MKASELRIGNYVDTMHNGICKVAVVFDSGVKVDIGDGAIQQYSDSPLRPDFAKVTPIPLTEEWLLKFGFDGDENEYNIGLPNGDGCDLSIEYSYGTACIKRKYVEDWLIEKYKSVNKTDDYCYIKFPEHVHQLQNLYFSLTNKELELKQIKQCN